MLGERKLVTVLFADISGFTALSEKLDPEAVRDLVNTCFARLVPTIKKHSGLVEKFIGDEVMAIFGAPVTHENDAELAALSALEMMQALADYNRERGMDLGMHIGINTGPAIAGGIGSPDDLQYGVLGDTVNLAARLADAAERGQIFLGAHTFRLIRPLFELDELEPIRVKGKSEPVPVYSLKGLKEKPGRPRGLEGYGLLSPLVGRESESNLLYRSADRLLGGQGGILGVIGEAGLGKTRLVAELKREVAARADPQRLARILEGATLSYGQTISFWPFQEILRLYMGITEADHSPSTWEKLASRVEALFPQGAGEILPYLAGLLAIDPPGEWGERLRYLDADALGKHIFLAVRGFFERLAQENLLVLVFEDLHWMDESSTRLLEYLLPLVEKETVLIVGVSRPYPNTPAARLQAAVAEKYGDYYTEIRLAPLSPAESAGLAKNLLQTELPARLQREIIQKSEGNPFFLEEVIRTLIETGIVTRDPGAGGWKVSGQAGRITIPDTIQGVIMARVDRLDESVKHVLCLAAVIGRSFFYRVLGAIEDRSHSIDQALEELQQVELILMKQRLPELEYIFKHALAQEATYESILIQQRRGLHRRVGQAIEEIFADRLEEFYGLLAYHYARAEAWEKAQDYLLKAGNEAGRLAADSEALAYYRQATEAYTLAFGDRWDPLLRASLERKIGEALWRRGEHLQALEHLQLGLSFLGRSLPETRLAIRLGILKEAIRQLGHRLLPGIFLPDQAAQPEPAAVEEVLLYEAITWIDGFINPERFLVGSLRELNTAEKNAFHLGTVMASIGIGLAADIIPFYGLAEIYFRQAAFLVERIQNPIATGLGHYGMLAHELNLGHLEKAARHSDMALSAYRQVGDLHGSFLVMSIYAYVLTFWGQFRRALELAKSVVKQSQEVSDRMSLGQGYLVQGFLHRLIGENLEQTISILESAIQISESVPDHYTTIVAMYELGRVYGKAGDIQRAFETLNTSGNLARKYQITMPYSQVSYYNGYAEVYLLAAGQSADSLRVSLMKKAARACRAALKHGRIFPVGMPEAMRLQGGYEWLRERPAEARRWWQRSMAKAEDLGLPYDAALARLELGRKFGEIDQMEKAEAALRTMGVNPI